MTVPSQTLAPLLGAYSMAPSEPGEQRVFYAALSDLALGGLELPVPAEGSGSERPGWDEANRNPTWDLLVTCIPTVMGRLGAWPGYGLASVDDGARSRALADVRRAADLAVELAERHGRRRVVAIQVHSAPGPHLGSAASLRRSLTEILTWDLAGAEVLVEHCDARLAGQAPAKGFLSLDEEIAVIGQVVGGASGLGLSINWGRSAIEGRSASTPVEHIDAAVGSGLLRAVVLSGATDAETAWGPAWGDAHIPPRGDDPALAPSSASLLDASAARAALVAAGAGCVVAVKVSVRPKGADVVSRLAVARAALDLVRAAWQVAHVDGDQRRGDQAP